MGVDSISNRGFLWVLSTFSYEDRIYALRESVNGALFGDRTLGRGLITAGQKSAFSGSSWAKCGRVEPFNSLFLPFSRWLQEVSLLMCFRPITRYRNRKPWILSIAFGSSGRIVTSSALRSAQCPVTWPHLHHTPDRTSGNCRCGATALPWRRRRRSGRCSRTTPSAVPGSSA